jgi:hypothetical protein
MWRISASFQWKLVGGRGMDDVEILLADYCSVLLDCIALGRSIGHRTMEDRRLRMFIRNTSRWLPDHSQDPCFHQCPAELFLHAITRARLVAHERLAGQVVPKVLAGHGLVLLSHEVLVEPDLIQDHFAALLGGGEGELLFSPGTRRVLGGGQGFHYLLKYVHRISQLIDLEPGADAGQDENGEGATNWNGLQQGLVVTLRLLAGRFVVAWVRVMGIAHKYDSRTLVQEDEVALSELREQCF